MLFFGEFANDQLVGTWYTFGDKGHILQIDTDFGELSDTIRLKGNIVYYSPNTCHTQFFAPNGWLKSEGMLLWGDSPEADGQEYGEWKYYDEGGNLIETKIFK